MREPPLDVEELTPGTVLGPYELLMPVGSGGMARVWAARTRSNGKLVALKMLLSQLSEHLEFRKMFFDEARVASMIRHPNVAQVFELVDLRGILTLAMEWVDGPSLMHVLRPDLDDESVDDPIRYPIPPRLAARVVADTCAGLQIAHDLVGEDGKPLGVVHRDVSPHNVLFTSDGQVKITDFGVAKAAGKSSVTIAGQVKGKLSYMSPEQLVGSGVDRRADVFALGCVLYEITTGQKPFQGEHDPQVMTAIMLGSFDPPSTILPNYPPALEGILTRALASEPMERFQSAEHMKRALEDFIASTGPAVTTVHVSKLVHERCGKQLAARALAIGGRAPRGSVIDPAEMMPPQPRVGNVRTQSASGAMEIASAQPKPSSLWVITAVAIGAVLGVGVLGTIKMMRKPKSIARPAVTMEAPAPPPSPVPVPTPVPTPAPLGSILIEAPDTPTHKVRIKVKPDAAVFIVDGTMLPKGTDSFLVPGDGGSLQVTVRADRYEEKTITLDERSPAEVDVTLRRLLRPDAGAKPAASSSADDASDVAPNPY